MSGVGGVSTTRPWLLRAAGGPREGGKATFAAATVQLFFHAAPPQPQPVVVGPYMSIFELFYYLITSYHYLATVYDSLPPPPYAACVTPLRAHPLAAVCATAPGGWAPGQGARGKANHCTYMRDQLASAPMGPAPWPRARRAPLGIGWPGIGPGQGNRALKCSKRRLR